MACAFVNRGHTFFLSCHQTNFASSGLCSRCCICSTHISLVPLPFSCTVALICFHSQWPAWVSEDHWCFSGWEDTFNFVSFVHPKSYRYLATSTPLPSPRVAHDWWVMDATVSVPSSLAPRIWGVITVSTAPSVGLNQIYPLWDNFLPSFLLFSCLYWLL